MMKAKQKPAQLHDLFSALQHESQDNPRLDSPVRKKQKKNDKVIENFWDELQSILKIYREKNL